MPTFSSHSRLDALLEATVLALVAMMLVDGTVPVPSARVCQVPTNRPLEEALAPFARELSIVLSGTLVAADDALNVQLLSIRMLLLLLL